MTEQILEQTGTVVKFSDMEIGDTAWAIIAGEPVNIIKTEWTAWGAMGSNARRAQGRNGKTFVYGNAKVFQTRDEAVSSLADAFTSNRIPRRVEPRDPATEYGPGVWERVTREFGG